MILNSNKKIKLCFLVEELEKETDLAMIFL